ncbi:hypothetical protein KIN20_036846 [Parelaphostrongylus tenuis]|uniref:Uncharacterized protein n=1 Tax=Parelaphostrongylus tenuis TaxID=148309 RepID=A0AAD5WLZ8_PARTN|nr:hypothetical protein KIN20_036846 [Parelaphostrongylus tenuis]
MSWIGMHHNRSAQYLDCSPGVLDDVLHPKLLADLRRPISVAGRNGKVPMRKSLLISIPSPLPFRQAHTKEGDQDEDAKTDLRTIDEINPFAKWVDDIPCSNQRYNLHWDINNTQVHSSRNLK